MSLGLSMWSDTGILHRKSVIVVGKEPIKMLKRLNRAARVSCSAKTNGKGFAPLRSSSDHTKMNGFYKRKLPSPPAVDFSSDDGKELFLEAIHNGTMENFYKLISQFLTQSEPTFCGLASLSMVLNALAIDPGRKWKESWRWFDESMLDSSESLEEIKAKGITIGELVYLAQRAGAKVNSFHARESNIDDFRKYVIKCSMGDDCHIISSYHRAALKQTGTGHFSPIGGYHAGKDMALMLDVARYKYPPHWIPLNILWKGMNTKDKTTGLTRGFMLLSKP